MIHSHKPQVLQPMMPSNVFRLYASIIRGLNNLAGACAAAWGLDTLLLLAHVNTCRQVCLAPLAAQQPGGCAAALGRSAR